MAKKNNYLDVIKPLPVSQAPAPTKPTPVPTGPMKNPPQQQQSSNNNTYNPSTGVYINNQGQGSSRGDAPYGANVLPPTSVAYGPSRTAHNTQPINNTPQTTPQTQPLPTSEFTPYTKPAQSSQSTQMQSQPQQPKQSYISETGKYQFDFFTSEGQTERVKNVYDTLNAVVNPFNKDIAQANINNTMVKRGVELAANHPFTTAGAATSIIAAYKAAATVIAANVARGEAIAASKTIMTSDVAKAATGELVDIPLLKTGGVAINTATEKAKLGIIKEIGEKISLEKGNKIAKWVMGGLAGWVTTGVFAQNEYGDAVQALTIAHGNAVNSGDVESAKELYDLLQEIKPKKLEFYLGPIAYLNNIAIKNEVGFEVGDINQKRMEEKEAKTISDEALAQKINAGEASSAEIAQYAKDNPYSGIAKSWASAQQNRDAQGNSIFGKLDENGNYVPSATELAKQKYEDEIQNKDALGNSIYGSINENGVYVPSYTELAKRQEAQAYYNSLQGGSSGSQQTQKYEPPSSLNFGLLKTSGGYETASKDANPQGEFVTDVNEIANYYFPGIPYEQLTQQQKDLIKMMSGK